MNAREAGVAVGVGLLAWMFFRSNAPVPLGLLEQLAAAIGGGLPSPGATPIAPPRRRAALRLVVDNTQGRR
jgi:hypothetical protein